MAVDAAEAVHEKFLAALASGSLARSADAPDPAAAGLSRADATDIFLSQLTSRQMDRLSRALQARGEGFYTIGSSGHEGNAAVAAALRVTDMAFLHYRSNAFQLHRSRQRPGGTPTWDMLLSFAASSEDPISGGRHKVIGSKPLAIPPQTSTIASHLPKAVGAAFSIGIARRLGMEDGPLPDDAVVLASFGDASANHSTAQGAFNTAGWSAFQGSPMPLIFLCEDNGIGISTRTPTGWIEAQFRHRAGLHYIQCDGSDLVSAYAGAKEAADYARRIHRSVYRDFLVDRLALPVLVGLKTDQERFAGAVNTMTCEAMMGDGKALQMATSHELGQNFARAFGVDFLGPSGERELAWTTSWGSSTR
ncbi:MAG TPA: thiamine pyrophosphate-dependent enzyme, partial [Sphingopyxis sp.]|nr:thiamine pyrophosphate-dependent enzyme [Sphingopyxis sp.]